MHRSFKALGWPRGMVRDCAACALERLHKVELKIRSVKTNFALNLASTGLNFIFPLITFPYVSRVLGAAGYGSAELAFQTASFFTLFGLLGVNLYGTRECAKVRDDNRALSAITEELLAIVFSSTALATVAFFLCVAIVPSFKAQAVYFVIAALSLPLNAIGVTWFLNANEQYAFIAVRNLVVKLGTVALMFLLVRDEGDIAAWVAISVIAGGLANVANFAYMRRNTRWVPFSELHIARHVKPMLLFFLATAATSVYTQLDTVMLGAMTTNEQVAYYQVAVKIKNVLVAVMTAMVGVVVPRASYYVGEGERDKFETLVSSTSRFALIYAPYASLMVGVFALPAIRLLSGNQYDAAVLPLQIMMAALVFICFSSITSQEILTPLGQEKWLTISYTVAAAVDFCLNLVLIPAYGAVGAAFSTALAEGLVVLLQLYASVKVWKLRRLFRGSLKLLPGVALMIASVAAGASLFGQTLPGACATALVTAAVAFAYLVLVKEPLVSDLIGTLRQRMRR